MKKKTIHAVVKYFYPVAAGIETNMLETYSVLAENGWDVTVHTSTDTLTESNVLQKKEYIRGVHVLRSALRLFGFSPNIPWGTADVVALHNFNIVPHSWILMYALLRKLVGARVPYILLTPHGGFTPDWFIFSKPVAFLKRVYHYTIGTLLINGAVDCLRAVSDWEKEQVICHGVRKGKVLTLTNGLENEAFMDVETLASKDIKFRVKEYGTYIIQIGRIYNIKNYETVINAMPLLPKNINYVIVGPVGDNAYKVELEQRIRRLKLEKRVFFAGVVRGVDKYYLIKKATLMVHMARRESFCNAVHEGMSQGLPCIVANNTALPLLIKNGINGYCIDTFNSVELAEKINFIVKNAHASTVKRMKETNRNFGEDESWTAVAGKINLILREKKIFAMQKIEPVAAH